MYDAQSIIEAGAKALAAQGDSTGAAQLRELAADLSLLMSGAARLEVFCSLYGGAHAAEWTDRAKQAGQ